MSFFEFLKDLIFYVCDGNLSSTLFNHFFKSGTFQFERSILEKKTLNLKQSSRWQNNIFLRNSKNDFLNGYSKSLMSEG